MQLEIIMLSEVNQKERQMPYVTTYTWNLKYDTNDLIYKTNSQTQNGHAVAKVGGEGGVEREFGVNKCKLVYRGSG